MNPARPIDRRFHLLVAKRAAAGHPEPFGLKHLGVGNEDAITPSFEERFKLIHDAVKKQHPEIVVIGTSGPFAGGEDFDNGWAFARKIGLAMVSGNGGRTTTSGSASVACLS